MTRVLLVEDNPGIARAVSARLKHHGFSVNVACDVPCALMEARRSRPDVAVIDLGLPGGSGFDVARNLNQKVCDREVPVVFVSGRCEDEFKFQARQENATAFLEKPFSAKDLLSAIDTAVSRPVGEMKISRARGC